jgi:hypothetical protein
MWIMCGVLDFIVCELRLWNQISVQLCVLQFAFLMFGDYVSGIKSISVNSV